MSRVGNILTITKGAIIRFWYALPILCILLVISLIWLSTTPPVLKYIVRIMCFLTMIALLASWIVLLFNKKWWKCIASFMLFYVGIGVLGIYIFATSINTPKPDGFGKEHPIPVGLTYNLPLTYVNDSCQAVPIDTLDTNTFLNIWYEGGVYSYDFYYGPLPAGEIYLRCFEVTENIPLSENFLTEDSRVEISQTTSFSKLVDQQSFTISEGDMGDYYAARIEVWFENETTRKEKKLLEKVYRIEGGI